MALTPILRWSPGLMIALAMERKERGALGGGAPRTRLMRVVRRALSVVVRLQDRLAHRVVRRRVSDRTQQRKGASLAVDGVLAGRAHEPERRPLPPERLLEEEPNPAQRDRRRRARDLLLVGQIQEVLAQIFLRELVGAPVIVLRELADGARVALLRSCGEPPELHILQHPST